MLKKIVIIAAAGVSLAFGNITGTVFKDLPLNGTNLNRYTVQDGNEKGVAGIIVTGVDEFGNSAIDTTDNNGNWALTGLNGKVRVKFSNIPSYLKESPSSDKKNSTIRFVQDGDTVNLALHNPQEFADTSNPILTSSLFSVGKNTGEPTLIYWHYKDNNSYNDTKDQYYGDSNQTGSVWGVAYDKDRDTIYYSAVVRRHMGLGPQGIGGIYTVKGARAGSAQVESWLDVVNDLGINLGSVDRSSDTCHELPNTPDKKTHDPDGYLKTGIAGLGDIDLSQDEKILYVMDVKNRQIIEINTTTKNKEAIYPISNPGCQGGTYRPWAISTHNDSLYVGVVCDASDSQNADDLHAYVLKFNGAGYDNVLDFNLNYTRTTTCTNEPAAWQPWTTDLTWHGESHPEPILSDIEFDETGAMILAFTDRYGMVSGNNDYAPACDSSDTAEGHSGGEILRACYNGNGWDLENNGTCGSVTTSGQGTNEGPGGGEFYLGDGAGRNDDGLEQYPLNHDESATGSLAILAGSKQVVTTVFDPITYDSGGAKVLSNTTGRSVFQKELYPSENGPGPHMGKAGGLGDLEIISAPAPVEIGNRVWFDENGNGIQDANETGIDNVRVQLVCSGYSDVEATTKNGGYYIFSNDNNKTDTENRKYNLAQLQPDNPNNCKVIIPNISSQTPLSHKQATTANQGADRTIDSNGEKNGDNSEASIASADIPYGGANNHSFDFGFKEVDACLGDYIWEDRNVNGIQDSGEIAPKDDNNNTLPIKVSLVDSNGSSVTDINGNRVAPVDINASGGYKFCQLMPGEYQIKVTIPQDWYVTRRDTNSSDDSKDSDMGNFLDTNKEVTMPIEVLESGENNMTFDGGIFKPSCLGSTVWEDKNANGIKEDGEPGIKDVKVTLLPYKDYGYENNQTVTGESFVTHTNDSGTYQFCGLIPGKYRVMFEAPPREDGTPRFTTVKNQGSDDKDSDVQAYKSGVVISDFVDVNSRQNNMTVFAGYIKDICLGDYVWYDKNLNGIQDTSESGIVDIKVHLTYADGSSVKDTYGNSIEIAKTDSNGKYKFCHLAPGRDYKIKFDLPNTYITTLQNKGDDTKDSDASEDGVILINKPMKDDWSNDFGIYCECDDYKVHPSKHKKLSAVTLNIFGGLLFIINIALIIAKRED